METEVEVVAGIAEFVCEHLKTGFYGVIEVHCQGDRVSFVRKQETFKPERFLTVAKPN